MKVIQCERNFFLVRLTRAPAKRKKVNADRVDNAFNFKCLNQDTRSELFLKQSLMFRNMFASTKH